MRRRTVPEAGKILANIVFVLSLMMLLNQAVRPLQDAARDLESYLLGRGKVDSEEELIGGFDHDVAGFGSLQHSVHERGRLKSNFTAIRSVGEQSPLLHQRVILDPQGNFLALGLFDEEINVAPHHSRGEEIDRVNRSLRELP